MNMLAPVLRRAGWMFLVGFCLLATVPARAEQQPIKDLSELPEVAQTEGIPPAGEAPEGERVLKLTEEDAVWIDLERKAVMVDGTICLRQGPLEMLACPLQTKEHESIVAVDSQAKVIHAALLSAGAEVGHAVQFQPEYQPAEGTEIEVYVLWVDDRGHRHSVAAQEWVRNVTNGQPLDAPWVFAGSLFAEDPISGQQRYGAEVGDLICVSNFPTATLDLPIESTELDENLLFEAFTEKIPPLDTPVRLVLIPRLEDEAE